ncbi:unnamed protein product [Mytilus edulis]|uniref:Uncharacterized protein n=1 Tax=Mytilus edulis TaxID=6550 RepID=A0A8S3V6R0_MYTED|nr:unnamed protein product [Mytilus edulis]
MLDREKLLLHSSTGRKFSLLMKKENKEVRPTDVDGRCYGICTYEQMMYVIVDANSVFTLDFDLNIEKLNSNSYKKFESNCCIRDRLYCTHSIDNSVVCYSKEGEKLWSFNDEIRFPFGIDIDTNGYVYVVCNGSNSIITLSQDGTK